MELVSCLLEVVEKTSPVPLSGFDREAFPLDLVFYVSVKSSRVKYLFHVPFVMESFFFSWFIWDTNRHWWFFMLTREWVVWVRLE